MVEEKKLNHQRGGGAEAGDSAGAYGRGSSHSVEQETLLGSNETMVKFNDGRLEEKKSTNESD
jgi:hypothetical protein